MFTQPAIIGAYIPPGQTASTYSPNSFGAKAFKDGTTGSFTLTFDVPIADKRFVVVATPIAADASKGISPILSTPSADANGNILQITILTTDDTHTAIDCGLCVSVFAIPTTD